MVAKGRRTRSSGPRPGQPITQTYPVNGQPLTPVVQVDNRLATLLGTYTRQLTRPLVGLIPQNYEPADIGWQHGPRESLLLFTEVVTRLILNGPGPGRSAEITRRRRDAIGTIPRHQALRYSTRPSFRYLVVPLARSR